MDSLRHVAVFISLAVFTISLALTVAASTSDFWVETEQIVRENVISSFSYAHSGLFYGERQLDRGRATKLEPFSGMWSNRNPLKQIENDIFIVYDEIQRGHTSFMDRTLWILCIFFLTLGILWIFIGLIISLLNSVKLNTETVMGPAGIYVWSILAGTF